MMLRLYLRPLDADINQQYLCKTSLRSLNKIQRSSVRKNKAERSLM